MEAKNGDAPCQHAPYDWAYAIDMQLALRKADRGDLLPRCERRL
jgi:hypothetical protein